MRISSRFCSVLCLALVLTSARIAGAGGVVGDGNPVSCTDAALDAALGGGGVVTFNCGAAPHAIIVSGVSELQADTEIDGGGNITLSGGNATPIFQVFNGVMVEIDDITLALGFGPYGAIENFGELTVADSRIENCTATGEGGAIANFGTLTVEEGTVITGNEAVTAGGGIANDGGTLTVLDSEISGNELTGTDGTESGGGIYNVGSTVVLRSTISDNFARDGGGIYNQGTLDLTDSLVENNSVSYTMLANGGGLHHASGNAVVTGTRFVGNTALIGYGGGVYVSPDSGITIQTSTFTENQAQAGGALVVSGSATVRNSTFHGNLGTYPAIGVGIQGQPGTLTLTNVTVSNNTASSGATVYLTNSDATLRFVTIADNTGGDGGLAAVNAELSLKSSIIAGNTPADCDTLILDSEGFNMAGDSSCLLNHVSDSNGTDPLLGELADNGGPTLTHLPEEASLAIDNAPCDGQETDQRGIARPQRLACDSGAVEVEPTTTTTSTTSSTLTTSTTAPDSTTTTTLDGGGGVCGDPIALVAPLASSSVASAVNASDALAVLNAAVSLFACELCVCDVDDSGAISATDALAVLRNAVGLGTPLTCPACG